MASAAAPESDPLIDLFARTRALTVELAAPLSDADASAQSMPEASPAKWHLAHTSWFFETFVLKPLPAYQPFDARYDYLFNSYYDGVGERLPRARRGMLTRPGLAEVLDYRAHVEAALIDALPKLDEDDRTLVELGCHHEAQHQELLLTDILHLFSLNPLLPALWPSSPRALRAPTSMGWREHAGGLVEIGHDGNGFAFDCEGPRHQTYLRPFAIADRLVSNCEWDAFIADGGYRRPELWLSDGWAWAQANAVERPLYRLGEDAFGPVGLSRRDPAAPVAHVGHYEADAYARWAGARLPTEFEWEHAVAGDDPCAGHQFDGVYAARPAASSGMFGDVWQWTASAFLPYPGYRPRAGAVGEYNGKFMSGQMVLRGASSATPRGTSRVTTRNFFPPTARWQFSGLRLARDI